MTAARSDRLHLVGSVPLPDSEAVFRACAQSMGDFLPRLPDGETGERLDYIGWQSDLFLNHPQFEAVPRSGGWSPRLRARLKPGVRAEDVTFDNLGYADVAIASYADFAKLKGQGVIRSDCRFMVAVPSPLGPVAAWLAPEVQAGLMAAYEKALVSEVRRMCAAIPHDQLAIQWDAPHEILAIEQALLDGKDGAAAAAPLYERLIRVGDLVPPAVQMGYHWCYGDFGHKHRLEPPTLARSVDATNAMNAGVHRPVNWFHMPVPRGRSDEAYFAPLTGVEPSDAVLYLGLLHLTDGYDGTMGRIATAKRSLSAFGIATECGFGRRDSSTVMDLLALHGRVAQAL